MFWRRCEVAIDGAAQQSGLLASWWLGRRARLDQLHGVLRRGSAVVSTARGRHGRNQHACSDNPPFQPPVLAAALPGPIYATFDRACM